MCRCLEISSACFDFTHSSGKEGAKLQLQCPGLDPKEYWQHRASSDVKESKSIQSSQLEVHEKSPMGVSKGESGAKQDEDVVWRKLNGFVDRKREIIITLIIYGSFKNWNTSTEDLFGERHRFWGPEKHSQIQRQLKPLTLLPKQLSCPHLLRSYRKALPSNLLRIAETLADRIKKENETTPACLAVIWNIHRTRPIWREGK